MVNVFYFFLPPLNILHRNSYDSFESKEKKMNLFLNLKSSPTDLKYHHHHHNHHVVSPARISLVLSRHFSLSFIASGWSSGLHPVSSHSCCMYVRAGRPAFAGPYAGVHRSTSSLHLQQCPACLVRLTCIVFVTGGRWPYSWCLVGCCRLDLFNIARKDCVSRGVMVSKRDYQIISSELVTQDGPHISGLMAQLNKT